MVISRSYSLFYKTHMTFRTHLTLTFTFEEIALYLIGLSAGSVNKTTTFYGQTLLTLNP